MFGLVTWAARWGISAECLQDLEQTIGLIPTDPAPLAGRSEAAVQNAERLRISAAGGRAWRNNSGAYRDESGRLVRYGLANDSAAQNEVIKSSDLIGIEPLLVLPEHVGQTVGVFSAVECKAEGWQYKGTPREKAQYAFGQLVLKLGGRFRFSSRVE